MEIMRSVGIILPKPFLLDTSRSLLTLLALDRFGDFVGDTVVAPVRETAAQALGVLLKFLDPSAVDEVHTTMVGMVRQPWAKRGKEAANLEKWQKFAWEVRHAGLLGLKYEVAVRKDLLVKSEEHSDGNGDAAMGSTPRPNILEDVVAAAVLAWVKVLHGHCQLTMYSMGDVDDDVRTVAASTLVPIIDKLAETLPEEELEQLYDTLWDCLTEDGDELGSSTGMVMDLLGGFLVAFLECC